ncbi:MAG: hypothetical protein WB424_01835 [Terracidiphilus sp.]
MSALGNLIGKFCAPCLRAGHHCQAQIKVDEEYLCLPCANDEVCYFFRGAEIRTPDRLHEEVDVFTVPRFSVTKIKIEEDSKIKAAALEMLKTHNRNEVNRFFNLPPKQLGGWVTEEEQARARRSLELFDARPNVKERSGWRQKTIYGRKVLVVGDGKNLPNVSLEAEKQLEDKRDGEVFFDAAMTVIAKYYGVPVDQLHRHSNRYEQRRRAVAYRALVDGLEISGKRVAARVFIAQCYLSTMKYIVKRKGSLYNEMVFLISEIRKIKK